MSIADEARRWIDSPRRKADDQWRHLVRHLLAENAELLLSRAELADENEHLRNWRDGDRDRNELIQLRATIRQVREYADELLSIPQTGLHAQCNTPTGRHLLRILGGES